MDGIPQKVHADEPAEEMHDTEPTEIHTESVQVPTKPTQISLAVVSPPIVTPPLPFYVKAIPDNLEQESFVFKYGVLAKWHAIDELADTSSHPPSYTEAQDEIRWFEYGGERANGDHPKAKKGHAKRKRSLYERSTNGKCFKR